MDVIGLNFITIQVFVGNDWRLLGFIQNEMWRTNKYFLEIPYVGSYITAVFYSRESLLAEVLNNEHDH